jgi:hypothetical protein
MFRTNRISLTYVYHQDAKRFPILHDQPEHRIQYVSVRSIHFPVSSKNSQETGVGDLPIQCDALADSGKSRRCDAMGRWEVG